MVDGNKLDKLYSQYNRREYVHPDPLEFLYNYDDVADREIVGLVASSLAYGRVAQILRSVSTALERMPSPSRFLRGSTRPGLHATFDGFKHRFSTGSELAELLYGAKMAIKRHGSLHACFTAGMNDDDETVTPALERFVGNLAKAKSSLVPRPSLGSSCKRLHLYLRWMVRKDDVDPGGWNNVCPSKLVVPLDTHMHKLSRAMGLTRRKQADRRTAEEITTAFRTVAPDDPVRYDFALTRLGIRTDTDMDLFVREYCEAKAG